MGERPIPGAPHQCTRGPPTGAPEPPPQRAQPARKRACREVGDGSLCPLPPHEQPVSSRPRAHAPRTSLRASVSAEPWKPHIQVTGGPPLATPCHPHSAQSQLTRSRDVGLVTGPHTHGPRTRGQWVAGPARTPRGRVVGHGWGPNTGGATPRQGTPFRGALVAPGQRANPAQKSARYGVWTGPQDHSPCDHSQWVASPGHAPLGRAVGRGGAPNPGRPAPKQEAPPLRRPPATPTGRRASSQKQAACRGASNPKPGKRTK